MTKRTVYEYVGENGTVISPVKLPGAESRELVRLIAGTGKILTDGVDQTSCRDVTPEDVEKWFEIDEPEVAMM